MIFCIIMLEVAVRRPCGHEGMHLVSNNTQIGCGIQAMFDLYYHLYASTEIEINQTRLRFSDCPAYCSLGFLFLAEQNRTLTCSFAVVAHPPQRVVIWVSVAFLSAQTSLAILHWLLSSTRRFCLQSCCSPDVFLFFTLFWVNSQEITCYRNAQTSPSGTNNQATVEITQIHFFPLMVDVNINWSAWPIS